MDKQKLTGIISSISAVMDENKQHLIELDARNGDGDLGLSMSGGFAAVLSYLESADETDLGRLLMKSSSAFNEAAPSTLGTIVSVCLMGMAKALKGQTDAGFEAVADALLQGIDAIMHKAGSKPGEKTILDSICPAAKVLRESANLGAEKASKLALEAAIQGVEATRGMMPVHGRAAYYGEKSKGLEDGGAVAGMLMFKGIANALAG